MFALAVLAYLGRQKKMNAYLIYLDCIAPVGVLHRETDSFARKTSIYIWSLNVYITM